MGYWVKQESSCNRRVIETGTDLARRFDLLVVGWHRCSTTVPFAQNISITATRLCTDFEIYYGEAEVLPT